MGKLCFQKEGPRGDLEEGSRQEVTQTKPIRHLENLTVRDEIDKLWRNRQIAVSFSRREEFREEF